MVRPALIKWQWDGYPRFHQNRTNLLLHIVAVPMFIAAFISTLTNLVLTQWLFAAVSLAATTVAFAVQGIGHQREPNPSIPFEGAADAVTRIFAEQWVTFPRFVLSGGWFAALKQASAATKP